MFGKMMLVKAAAATLAVGAGVPALAAVTSVPAPVPSAVVTQLAAATGITPTAEAPAPEVVDPTGETGVVPEPQQEPAQEPAPEPAVRQVVAAPAAAEHERSRVVEIVPRTVPAPPRVNPAPGIGRGGAEADHEDEHDGFESGSIEPEHGPEHDD